MRATIERQQIEVERVAVIVRRPLAVAAVARDLPVDLRRAARAGRVASRRRWRQFGQRAARDVQRQRLAEQMRVRAEVVREVALDVRQLAIEREQQIDEPRRVRRRCRRLPAKKCSAQIHDSERNASSSMLAQLMPDERRVRVEPARRARRRTDRDTSLAGQPERAAERQPVLVAVQLPDDLVVAARRVEIRHRRPEAPRRATVDVHRIELPVGMAHRAGRRRIAARGSRADRTGRRGSRSARAAASAGAVGKRPRIASTSDSVRAGDRRSAAGADAKWRASSRCASPPVARRSAARAASQGGAARQRGRQRRRDSRRRDEPRADAVHGDSAPHARAAPAELVRRPSARGARASYLSRAICGGQSRSRRSRAGRSDLAVDASSHCSRTRGQVHAWQVGVRVARQLAGQRRIVEQPQRSWSASASWSPSGASRPCAPSVRIAGTPPASRRDDRQTAGEGLEHRRRHVVDVRALHVDVVRGVVARRSRPARRGRRTSTCAQPELADQRAQRAAPASRRRRASATRRASAPGRARNARSVHGDVVEGSKFRVDTSRGRSGSRSRKRKRSRSTMFGMIGASMPNRANTSTRNRDGTTLRSTRAIARPRDRRAPEVVGRLRRCGSSARPGVPSDARDEDRRQRREQERAVRGGEHVHDVGAPSSRRSSAR